MIRVKFKIENDKFHSLTIEGHANSTTIEGHDIVCAGVSACSVGALNSLENPKSFNIKMNEGFISVIAIDNVSLHDEIVLKTLMTQLETIQESYKKFITITK